MNVLIRSFICLAFFVCEAFAFSQSVSPVIVEYKGKAEGRIALLNNTVIPMAVMLEPKSFSISPDGNGIYRSLDPDIHVQLSSMSFRIDPGQTYYVFYKAKADKLPAWFTVYATFSSLQHREGLDVRILLPHTVYIYPKKQQTKETAAVRQATYSPASNKVVCELENNTPDLERVQEVRVSSKTKTVTAAGFPLLPGAHRRVEVSWSEKEAPGAVQFRLEHSVLNQPLVAAN